MGSNKVTRCICHGRTFKEILAYARTHDLHSVEELQCRDYCSNGCGLCIPYVEQVLESEQLTFTPGEPFDNNQ